MLQEVVDHTVKRGCSDNCKEILLNHILITKKSLPPDIYYNDAKETKS